MIFIDNLVFTGSRGEGGERRALSGVPPERKMLTNPEAYITKYTSIRIKTDVTNLRGVALFSEYEDKQMSFQKRNLMLVYEY